MSFMFLQFFRWTKVGNHTCFLDTQNIANQREVILFGGDFAPLFCSTDWNTRNGYILPIFAFPRKTKNPDFVWKSGFYCFLFFLQSGATRNRTGDTRIFSPLLYQLSYGTFLVSVGKAPVRHLFPSKLSAKVRYFSKLQTPFLSVVVNKLDFRLFFFVAGYPKEH